MEQERSAAVRDEPNPQCLTLVETQKSSDFRENEAGIPGGENRTRSPAIFRRCKKAFAVVSLSCCFVSIPAMIHKALPPLLPRTEKAALFSESPTAPTAATAVSALPEPVFKNGEPTAPLCSVLETNSGSLSGPNPFKNGEPRVPVCSVLETNPAAMSAPSNPLKNGEPLVPVSSVSEAKSATISAPLSEFSENREDVKTVSSVSAPKSEPVSAPLPKSSETGYAKPPASVSQTRAAAFDPFPVPKRLKKRVDFWIKVFGTYTSDDIIVYDGRYAGVVYEVIDTTSPEFHEQNDSNRDKTAEAARQRYEQFLAAMPWDSPQSMNREERKIYSLYKHIPGLTEEAMKDAWCRVLAHRGLANTFKDALIRAGAYLDAMKKTFAERKLPEDLVYLTLIESKFNPFALSYMGAAGVWQFMPRTGKHYNLTINGLIDERRDPVLSTRAAALLLEHNYDLLKSWPLAVTAYNHGVKGVRNAVANLNSEDIADIVEAYDGPRFEFASRNFYAEFLAAREVGTRYKEYFKDVEISRPQTVAVLKLPEHVAAQTLEKYFDFPADLIRELNPALDESVFSGKNFIPKDYPLNVPAHRKEQFEEIYKTIPAELKYDYVLPQIKYCVRRGQTLSAIAKAHNCSIKEFMRLNGIMNPRRIRPGQWLNIPGQYLPLENEEESPESEESAIIATGTPDSIKSDSVGSEINNDRVKNEEEARYDSSSAESRTNHRVRKGQTLGKIARLYNISPKAIIELNSIKNPQHIRAGQMLRIPEG